MYGEREGSSFISVFATFPGIFKVLFSDVYFWCLCKKFRLTVIVWTYIWVLDSVFLCQHHAFLLILLYGI